MPAFAALEQRLASACMKSLANVSVVRGNGPAFEALLRTADQESWDNAAISTHSLRYSNSIALAAGDALTVETGIYAGTYVVHGVPMRINGSDFKTALVKQ